MSARHLAAAAAALVALHLPARAQIAPVERGRAVFEHSCAPCHGTGRGNDGRALLPGTDALRVKYHGELPAALEERTDLTVDTLRLFVRRGTWSMPPFRKTELSEADIADIAAYIAETAKRAAAKR
jgi:mono/diheme cytochrome c family protein